MKKNLSLVEVTFTRWNLVFHFTIVRKMDWKQKRINGNIESYGIAEEALISSFIVNRSIISWKEKE